jgi:hypothetical protein
MDEEFDGRTRTEIVRDADGIAGALSHADRHVAVTAGTPLASPAFQLVAACCRWPPSQARNAAIQAAAAPVADWNAVVLTARRQRVAGLVYDALLAAGVQLPAAPAAEFVRRAQAIFRKNLLLAAETCRLQKLLDAAEIPPVALKGVALAQLAYGSLKVKDTHDIDLLIPEDRAVAAMALLERDGYALSFPSSQLSATQRRAVVRYSREVAFIHRDSRVFAELQWRVADNPELLSSAPLDGSSAQSIAAQFPVPSEAYLRQASLGSPVLLGRSPPRTGHRPPLVCSFQRETDAPRLQHHRHRPDH